MRERVVVPSALRRFSDGEAHVEVAVASEPCRLRDVLEALAARHPGVTARVLDEQHRLRRHVNVFVGDEECRQLGGLDAQVGPGTEVVVLPAVSGGAARRAGTVTACPRTKS
jgi:molybdopterin converting factor small subunit